MAHLGERVAALVDGQLTAEGVERAHAHLAGCRACREAVEAERLMKARLLALHGPQPGAELVQRLLVMGGPNGPLPPRAGYVPGTPRPQPVGLPRSVPVPVEPVGMVTVGQPPALPVAVAGRPAGRQPRPMAVRSGSSGPGRSPSQRRSRLAVAAVFGALSVVGVGLTGMSAGAAIGTPSTPTVVPPVNTFVVQHAGTTRNLPFADASAGWELTGAGEDSGSGR